MAKIHLMVGIACLTAFCSCVDFEKQTMTYKYDKEKDQLRIFQEYEGIYGNNNKIYENNISEEEKSHLDYVMNNERTFFFSNWVFEYDRGKVKKEINEKKKEIKNAEDDREIKTGKALVRFGENILHNIKVTNGKFYLNNEKKLSGYQLVTINQISKLIDELNSLFNNHPELLEKIYEESSKETQLLFKKASKSGHKWLILDRNCIKARIPLSKQDFKNSFIRSDIESIRFMLENDFWIFYFNDVMEISFGTPEAKLVEIKAKLSKKYKYKPNAMKYVSEKYGIEKEIDIKKIKDEYLKTETKENKADPDYYPGKKLGRPEIWRKTDDGILNVVFSEGYFYALKIILNISQENLEKCIDPKLKHKDLINTEGNPEKLRGKVYNLKGQLIRIEEKMPRASKDRGKEIPEDLILYVGQILEKGSGMPYTFRAVTVPEGIKVGDEVEIPGIYIQIYSYENRVGTTTHTPFIFGKILKKVEDKEKIKLPTKYILKTSELKEYRMHPEKRIKKND